MDLQLIKDRLRYFNRDVLNPFMFSFAGRSYSPYGIVEHVGRKSGRVYTTPILVKSLEDGFVIPLPYGREVDWCRNVIAANGAVIVHQGKAYRIESPEIIPSSEGLDAFPEWMSWLLNATETELYLRVRRVSSSPEPPTTYRRIIAGYPVGHGILTLGVLILIAILLMVGVRSLSRKKNASS